MKTIGIIGGLGPESTVDYYKGIIRTFQDTYVDLAYPEIVVYSADVNKLLKLVEAEEWKQLVDWLVARVRSVHSAGADFAVIGANTAHIVFDEVESRSPIPMLSIINETCRRAESLGLKKPGLMGTGFTMKSDFFQKPFYKKGITVVVPDEEDQKYIHDKLMSEIELGIIKDTTREGLLSIVKKMIEKESIDSVILGCTELPLILERDEFGIPFLNTTSIHVDSIVEYCINK
jgi:aspartate racemase